MIVQSNDFKKRTDAKIHFHNFFSLLLLLFKARCKHTHIHIQYLKLDTCNQTTQDSCWYQVWTELLTHRYFQCLYTFFCYVAWVTFGRKDLRDIQEEVGRLLYSDAFNAAVRNMTDGDSGHTSTTVNGSVKTGAADPEATACKSAFKQRYVEAE